MTLPSISTFFKEHKNRSASQYGLQALSKIVFAALSRCPGADTTGLSSDGASQTITVYQIDVAALPVVLGGVYDTIAALDDQDLLDDITSYDKNGDAAVALTADGQTYMVALAVFLVGGVPVIRGFFGDEAADTGEVALTEQEIYEAMVAAGEATYDGTPGMVFARIKVQRVATDTITMTHIAAATNDDLKAERMRAGCI